MRIQLLNNVANAGAVRLLLTLLSLLVLGSCATLDRAECEVGDWNSIGFADGAVGHGSEFLGLHQKACAKHGINVAAAEYTQGYRMGVEEFCVPSTGYRVGLREEEYRYICPVKLESEFLFAYKDGLRDALTELHLRSHHLEDSLWLARTRLPSRGMVADAGNAQRPLSHHYVYYSRTVAALRNRLGNLRDREFRIRSLMTRASRRLETVVE